MLCTHTGTLACHIISFIKMTTVQTRPVRAAHPSQFRRGVCQTYKTIHTQPLSRPEKGHRLSAINRERAQIRYETVSHFRWGARGMK